MNGTVIRSTALLIASGALCGCQTGTDSGPSVPSGASDARAAFIRCVFDQPPPPRDGHALEAAVRRELQRDRYAFAIRGGRCESALDAARGHDAATAAFARAWDDLLPLLQAREPDDIRTEQSLRHVGNAYRVW